jgi:3-oxoacyl-[acyl-carrier protein] reductase
MARRLAAQGYAVAALSRTAAELEETVDMVASAGGRAIPVVADVTRLGEVERAVEAARALGEIDLLVNNVGVGGRSGLCGTAIRTRGGGPSR